MEGVWLKILNCVTPVLKSKIQLAELSKFNLEIDDVIIVFSYYDSLVYKIYHSSALLAQGYKLYEHRFPVYCSLRAEDSQCSSKQTPPMPLQLPSDPNTDPQQDAGFLPQTDYSKVHCLTHSFSLALKHLGCSLWKPT